MKHTLMLISILAVAACGGSKPQPEAAKPAPPAPEPERVAEVRPEPPPEPPAPPPPPPAKTWQARAELAPLKGVKIKTTTVTFTQEEGGPTAVGTEGWFTGIKPGKFQLVVHEGTDCGPTGAKAGAPMGSSAIAFTVAKATTALELTEPAPVQLDGDAAVIGHALVLHEDKQGKPGKPLACGQIRPGE